MKRLLPALFGLVLVLLLVSQAHAQITIAQGYNPPKLGKDTLCFKYRFVPGDSLVYFTEAIDSVVFPGDPHVVKRRREVVAVICDSAEADSVFYLRFRFLAADERQASSNGDTTARETFPWIQRWTSVTMDANGRRRKVTADNDRRAAVTPGGVFRTLLFPSFGAQRCGRQNESWLAMDTTLYAENSVPEPAVAHTSLFRVLDYADTIGRRFAQIQYTQTSLGRVDMRPLGTKMIVDGTINAYGKCSFDTTTWVPFHHASTSEQKVTIRREGQPDKEGKYSTLMHTKLVLLASSDPQRVWHEGKTRREPKGAGKRKRPTGTQKRQ
jgi:hypothetical protein